MRRVGSAPPTTTVRRPARPGLHVESGSAIVEFLVIGVGILVPLAYVVLSVLAVQGAAFASTQAVREAGRAFGTAGTAAVGRDRALAAARLAFADHGLSLPDGALRVACPDGPCLSPGSLVEVEVDWSVALPWVPGTLDADVPARMPIVAVHRIRVDDLRSSPDARG